MNHVQRRIIPALVSSLVWLGCGWDVARGQELDEDAALRALIEYSREEEKARDWPYDKLTANADTIVIATLVSQAEIEFDAALAAGVGDEERLTCVASKLKAVAVLKGKPKGDRLEVLHLRWNPSVTVLWNHSFLRFQTEMELPKVVPVVVDDKIVDYGQRTGKADVIKPEYLLFLRSRSDGKYEPGSGQRYAGYSSRLLNN